MAGHFAVTPQAHRLAIALIAVGQGDRAEFQFVYVVTRAKLLRICVEVCGEQSGAEDALADVYIAIWRHAASWVPGRASPISWLAKIARNKAIDWRRAHPPARHITLDDAPDLVDGALDAETLLIRVETHDYLAFSLSALDACARNLIQSAFFDGITYAELAHRNAMPLGTVKSQIRRGLAKMRVIFDTSLAGGLNIAGY